MWKFLYQLASPKHFFRYSQIGLPWLGWTAFLFLLAGMIWGLWFAPPDYQQGDAFRIIYIHVPAAFLSLGLYAAMSFWAFLLLVWRIKIAGLLLASTLSTGASMAFLALLTGSLWGKPMWGTWWVWDARLTSEFILLLLYLALLAMRYVFKEKQEGEKIIAIITLVGLIDLPIIHYSVYWWNTLHQGATLSLFAKPKIAWPMLYPLLCTLIGFSCYCFWLILNQATHYVLWRERKQLWVHEVLQKDNV